MNVGVISKEQHAKSHCAAITAAGHKVVMLGGSPTALPPACDVIVCRPASVSHQGFNIAMKHKRSGGWVIISNSLNEIIQNLADGPESPPTVEFRTAKEVVEYMSARLGAYGPHLHEPKAESLVRKLIALQGADEHRVMASWIGALASMKKPAVRGYTKKGAGVKNSGFVHVYSSTASMRGGSRTYGYQVNDPAAFSLIVDELGLNTKKPSRKKTNKRPDPPPVIAVSGSTPAPTPVVVVEEPEVQAPAPKPPPEPEPTSPPEWDTHLKAALGLLLQEMNEANVEKLTVAADGTYSFRRVTIVEGKGSVKAG